VALSTSFRKDPPGTVATSGAGPGVRALGRLLGRAGVADPRWLTLATVVVGAILLVRRGGGDASLSLAVAFLSPAAALGVVFGGGDLVLLAIVLAVLPLGGLAVLGTMAVWLGLFSATGTIGPGIGATSLALYAGLPPTAPAGAMSLVPAIVPASAALARRFLIRPWLALAATALLLARWLSPAASPDDVVTPIVLALLARVSTSASDANSGR
jgi:hypothetical protein